MKKNSIKISIFTLLMFVSGLLQIDILDINWESLDSIRTLHVLSSIVIMLFLILPFTIVHHYSLLFVKKVYSKDGFVLSFLLFCTIASGIYLFFVGNRGGDIIGRYAFYIHLFGSFLLIVSLSYHIIKANKKIRGSFFVATLFFITFYPSISYSKNKLTLIELDDKVKRYHSEDWTNSAKCKSCHKDIFNQWADSNHRNLTSSNPYYMVLETLAAEDKGEEFRQWCMGCHNPSAVTTKERKTSHPFSNNLMDNRIFDKGAKGLINDFKRFGNFKLEEGVSCVACHRIVKANARGNASYALNLTDRKKYSFEDSKFTIGQFLSEKFINSKPNIHKQSYQKKLYKDSKYCASCHNEFLPLSGKKIVSTFEEWEKSPFNNPKNPSKHKSCIDCHMTNLKDGNFTPLKGRSTAGGKLKKDIKVHYFAGANHFLSGLKNKINEEQSIQLLKRSAKIDIEYEDKKLKVGVKNVGAGHHLPTGVADFRELWLEVTIFDRDKRIIFESGKLDKNGDIKKGARIFRKVFGDKSGKPVGLMFWRYEKLLSDTRIASLERRVETYDIDAKDIKYPIKIVVKLNFRIYPQWVTKIVQKLYPELPNPPIIELNKVIKKIEKNTSS